MTTAEFQVLVSRVSRSFGLTLRLLPNSVRPSLSLAYALARVSDTIADCARESQEFRVECLRGLPERIPTVSVSDPAEQELLRHLPEFLTMLEASPDQDLILTVWGKIREGQILDLERFPSSTPLSAHELARYVYLVAGCVGEFWTELCTRHIANFSRKPKVEMLALGREFGEGLQRVNILRDRHSDAASGRIYVARDALPNELASARAGMQSGLHYAAQIASRRLRAAVALPALLGNQTLDLIAHQPDAARVKVPRSRVWTTLVRAFFTPLLLLSVLLLGNLSANAANSFAPDKTGWTLREGALSETSGLAVSQQDPRFFWALNDSGNGPRLFLLDALGGAHGSVDIADVRNVDWEDMDSFRLNGNPFLLIADTGDNQARRDACKLIIVPEPDVRSGRVDGTIAPAWMIRYRYEDGPRDCEAVAVDSRERKVFMISKRTLPPVLYEVPLQPAATKEPILARRLGPVNLPAADLWEGPYAGQPTGLSFSPDGHMAAVLTYARVFLFQRRPGESWADAFAREPERLRRHGLEQAEAIAFSAEGQKIHVISEGRNGRICTYERVAGD